MRNVLAQACWLALAAILEVPMAASAANAGIGVLVLRPSSVPASLSSSPPLLPFSAASGTTGPEVSADAGLGGMAMFAIAATANAKTKASPQEGVCH